MKDSDSPKHDPLNDAQACIVWHPADRAPTPGLLKALRNKGMLIIDADDAHTAFAAANRVAQSARRTVIVLDTRDELHDVERTISAIERFLPRVLCWAHQPGANPPLVPLVQPAASKPTREPTPTPARQHPVPLRLVGRDGDPQEETETRQQQEPTAAVKTAPRAPLSARDVLDADELDALLAGELGDRKH